MNSSDDHLVGGGGSAGGVLAASARRGPTTRVPLLEAGPPEDADAIRVEEIRQCQVIVALLQAGRHQGGLDRGLRRDAALWR
jgi:choline dehydrogenase-like flavoprotein